MIRSAVFPFSAVVGQDNVKLALLLNVVNPAIGGVLISGDKGTAKTTLVRGLAHLRGGLRVIDIPLGVTEDRLTGGLDMESVVQKGVRRFEKGLLGEADGQFVFVDEVNLMSDHIVNILVTVSSQGENFVEREGISASHPCRFVLVGSMNPEEGLLRPSLLDKFGLYIGARGESDTMARAEIMRRRLAFEDDPEAFLRRYAEANRELNIRLDEAARALPHIRLTAPQYAALAKISRQGGCAGHRCEIVMAETARALAAWNRREAVVDADMECASKFALPHRLRDTQPVTRQPMPPEQNSDGKDSEQNQDGANEPLTGQESSLCGEDDNPPEQIDGIDLMPPLSISFPPDKGKKPAGTGKRNKVRSGGSSGRYVKARLPGGKAFDIALDATLRAAALRQHGRSPSGVAIAIETDDLRQKIREKRIGTTILFVVDASGSMGARRRMAAVKGAVMSLLNEAYQKRDKVGLVAFRNQSGEILLDITRSVDLAEKRLRALPTGGRTPLAAGLTQAYRILAADKLKNPQARQYLVLISDGKANVPLLSDDPYRDAEMAADKFIPLGTDIIVLDTENGYIRFGYAEKLARRLGASYLHLDAVTKSDITSGVKGFIHHYF